MEVLFVLVVAVVATVLIVAAVHAHSRKIEETWQDAANQLGMQFRSGSVMRSKTIQGHLYNNRVEVDTFSKSSGKSSSTYTRYRVHYPEHLRMGLKLKRQGFFAGVAALFGSQDIEVGDPQFDREMKISYTTVEAVFIQEACRNGLVPDPLHHGGESPPGEHLL